MSSGLQRIRAGAICLGLRYQAVLLSRCLPSVWGNAIMSTGPELPFTKLHPHRGLSSVVGEGRLWPGIGKEFLADSWQSPILGRAGGEELCGRRHFGATSKASEADGDVIANQMIGYAANCRKNGASHIEVTRVLEQGHNFLLSQGPSATSAAGKVLLMLSTFHVDGGKLHEAVEVLQKARNLEGSALEISVSASQALVGVLLRLHKDSDAVLEARSMKELVDTSGGLPLELSKELKFRAGATVQFVELATSSKTSGTLCDINDLPASFNDMGAHEGGTASALLDIAECAHIRGHLSQAKDYYEKASALAESSLAKGYSGLSAGAMTCEDVLVGSLAGLGQVACQLSDFDDAEVKLTKALTLAEQINGDTHQRVGAVLACIADVYARRGQGKGSNDLILTEGLYRKAIELLRSPALDAPGRDVDLSDIMAICRARLAAVLEQVKNRESEAQKLLAWSIASWKGSRSLSDILAQEVALEPNATVVSAQVGYVHVGRYVVIDVRLGRVLY